MTLPARSLPLHEEESDGVIQARKLRCLPGGCRFEYQTAEPINRESLERLPRSRLEVRAFSRFLPDALDQFELYHRDLFLTGTIGGTRLVARCVTDGTRVDLERELIGAGLGHRVEMDEL